MKAQTCLHRKTKSAIFSVLLESKVKLLQIAVGAVQFFSSSGTTSIPGLLGQVTTVYVVS